MERSQPHTKQPPSTAANLGALIGVARDDGPPPSARAAASATPLRPRVPTLQFYGSPPVIRSKPSPPLPARAIGAPKAPLPSRVATTSERASKPPPLPARASTKPLPPRATAKPPLPARASTKPPLPAQASTKPPLPARATMKPPPLPPRANATPRIDADATPTEPLAALIAAELSRSDEYAARLDARARPDAEPETQPMLDSSIDVSASELADVSTPQLGVHAIEEASDARSDRPPPPSSPPDAFDLARAIPLARWRQRGTLVAAAGIAATFAAFAANVVVIAYLADALAPPVPSAIALVSVAARAGANAPRSAPPRACEIVGEPRTVARALVAGGVEATSADGRFAIGVTTSSQEGRAIELDATTLATLGTARIVAARQLKRVVPLLPPRDVVDVAGDADDRSRTLADPKKVAITIAPLRIWKLAGQVDAVRAAPLTSMNGYAVALRRGDAIWLGATGGDDAETPYAPLARVSDAGHRVGAPSVAVSGDAVVVAWAERAPDSPWKVRWARWRPGMAPETPHDLSLAPGGSGEQAMSPSVVGLGDGRVLLAWTEGPSSDHQVRAQVIGADDAPSGSAFGVSTPGTFAGQPTIALGGDGRGVVAFFASRGGDLDVVATRVRCAR